MSDNIIILILIILKTLILNHHPASDKTDKELNMRPDDKDTEAPPSYITYQEVTVFFLLSVILSLFSTYKTTKESVISGECREFALKKDILSRLFLNRQQIFVIIHFF